MAITVSQLISILETCNQDAIVLGDKNNEITGSLFPLIMKEALGAVTIVAAGVSYKVFIENCSTDYYVDQEQWRYQPAGVPLAGIPAVYIGSGVSIVAPLWDKKFEQ